MARAFPLETVRTVARERAEAAARELGDHARAAHLPRHEGRALGLRERLGVDHDRPRAEDHDARQIRVRDRDPLHGIRKLKEAALARLEPDRLALSDRRYRVAAQRDAALPRGTAVAR